MRMVRKTVKVMPASLAARALALQVVRHAPKANHLLRIEADWHSEREAQEVERSPSLSMLSELDDAAIFVAKEVPTAMR